MYLLIEQSWKAIFYTSTEKFCWVETTFCKEMTLYSAQEKGVQV